MSEELDLESFRHWGMHPTGDAVASPLAINPRIREQITAAILEIIEPVGAVEQPCVVDTLPLAQDIMANVCKVLTTAAERPEGVDIPRLPVGTPVEKPSGYPFPGVIVSAFHTTEGNERFVVEATGEAYRGMLHIFNGGQLRALTSAATERRP